ncbi:STAS domain-containing protein [Kingella kingae]|uniref:STAS domain-containing protein n=1 Tax=Kingella kingae TaxID=504 RepID=UPI0004236400|nr:STAS domain-containing protein [Kingella kingae]MBD3614550.1 STAS domain-containing protein [Kingella kingae]MBD3632883.1 STAS domain-containing protein [Kingella kingae]MBD3660192.1 STAS domain-containing protein [Kingella kingae]MDK4565062.1 STAS domain-containing protein [Kingella kingae]MDK4574885.1 STAS domain-containing protein [Kingella kingae]
MRSEVREQCVYVAGDVSVQTLNSGAYREFLQQCRLPNIQTVDFSGVERADSACLALILQALRQSGQSSLHIQALPESVQLLAQLYEVEEWLVH